MGSGYGGVGGRERERGSAGACQECLMTLRCLRFLYLRRQCRARIEMMKDACIGRRYISQLETMRVKDVFSCLVTVRYIHKLSISCLCSGCGSGITRGACTYVGCHWNQPGCKVDLKAWYVQAMAVSTALYPSISPSK